MNIGAKSAALVLWLLTASAGAASTIPANCDDRGLMISTSTLGWQMDASTVHDWIRGRVSWLKAGFGVEGIALVWVDLLRYFKDANDYVQHTGCEDLPELRVGHRVHQEPEELFGETFEEESEVGLVAYQPAGQPLLRGSGQSSPRAGGYVAAKSASSFGQPGSSGGGSAAPGLRKSGGDNPEAEEPDGNNPVPGDDAGRVVVPAVPLPISAPFLAIALAGLAVVGRMRKPAA